MKTILSLLSIFFVAISFAQPAIMYSVNAKGEIKRYSLKFYDEFNRKELDRTKWMTSYPWGQNYSGTCYQEWMTDGENFTFEDGKLGMVIKREQVTARGVGYEADTFKLQDGKDNLRTWEYTSGMIFSKEKFRKGIFEVRFKLPEGAGFWPAFWLFGGKPNEEFDIFEAKGEKGDQVHYDMHCPDGDCKGFGDWLRMNQNFATGFNTMSGQWNENSAYWYLNGQSIAAWKGTLKEPANIIANLGLANNFGCPFGPGENEQTPFPATYEVDYIRLFQESEVSEYIRFDRKGTEKYAFEHGSAAVRRKGPDMKKNLRAMKRDNEAETMGHIRIYRDEPLNRLIIQFDDRSSSKRVKMSVVDRSGVERLLISTINGSVLTLDLASLEDGVYQLKINAGSNELVEVLDIYTTGVTR